MPRGGRKNIPVILVKKLTVVCDLNEMPAVKALIPSFVVNLTTRTDMKNIIYSTIFMCFLLGALTACSAGGGALSAAGLNARLLGPAWGRDRYQAVVYPASRPQAVTVSVSRNKPQEARQ